MGEGRTRIGRPGVKTSEFWVTVAVLVASMLEGAGVDIEVGMAESLAAGLYALSRALFKTSGG